MLILAVFPILGNVKPCKTTFSVQTAVLYGVAVGHESHSGDNCTHSFSMKMLTCNCVQMAWNSVGGDVTLLGAEPETLATEML
jgi:hypothetical protein